MHILWGALFQHKHSEFADATSRQSRSWGPVASHSLRRCQDTGFLSQGLTSCLICFILDKPGRRWGLRVTETPWAR